MDRHDYEKHRQFMGAIQPIIRAKANAFCLFIPKITLWSDGRMEHKYPPEWEELSAAYDEIIKAMARAYGMEPNRPGTAKPPLPAP